MMSLEKLEKIREERGLTIAKAKECQVNHVEENFYTVKSQSGNGEYAVYQVDGEWHCECPDHTYRHLKCKHLFAVEISLKMKEQVKQNVVIEPLSTSNLRILLLGEYSEGCGYDTTRSMTFKGTSVRHVVNTSASSWLSKMKASPQVITSAMQLYFTGESLRNVQKFLKVARCPS